MNKISPQVVNRRIESFEKRFGKAHLYLAYHAAFPLALTSDILYGLWANFQRDIHGEVLNIPWIAVADLLLSNLCDEVGYELYEMDLAVRNALLKRLKEDKKFGKQRINELSDFLLEYIQQQLQSDDPDIRDFAQNQRWIALAYTQPNQVARELALAFSKLDLEDKAELMRLTSLTETLAEPLIEFQPLLIYAREIGKFARGNLEAGTDKLSKVAIGSKQIQVVGASLIVPEQLAQSLIDSKIFSPIPQKKPAVWLKINYFITLIPFIGVGLIFLQNLHSPSLNSMYPSLPPVPDYENYQNLSFADYYKQGHAAYKDKDYQRAIDNFSRAIQQQPKHAKALVNRGNARYNLKDYEGAMSDYTEALQINPQEVKAWINRGNVRYVLAAYSNDPDREYNQALSDFNQALLLDNREIEAYVRRGIVRSEIAKYSGNSQGDYPQAIEDFTQAIKLNPSKAEAYFQRGVVYSQIAQYSSDYTQKYKQAIADFNRALSINSKLAKAYLKRGMVQYELAQYGGKDSEAHRLKAIEDLQTSAKISLEKKDMDNYQQALSNICVIEESKCDTLNLSK
jgi:tetratricopeptide (TPR) repeat protein